MLIGSLSARDLKADPESVFEQIHSRILTGARSIIGAPGISGRFTDVISFDQIARQRKKLVQDLADYGHYAGLDMSFEISAAARAPDERAEAVVGYVQTTVIQLATGLRVDIDLYERARDRWQLTAMKTVGGPTMKHELVLDLVTDAVRRMLDTSKGEAPHAAIDVVPGAIVPLGSTVLLDGSRSVDPDHDAMLWLWCQLDAPAGAGVLPGSGATRAQLAFTPAKEGTYRFALHIIKAVRAADTEGWGCDAPTPKDYSVRVAEVVVRLPPRARAGDSLQLEVAPGIPTERRLDGRCGSCTEYRWRQTSGPSVALTIPRSTSTCADWQPVSTASLADGSFATTCEFTPGPPGHYTFELIARNEINEARDEVHFLIAPKPFVIVGPRHLKAVVSVPLELSAIASYDALDSDPIFQWEAREQEFAPGVGQNCFPSGDYQHGAMVLYPQGKVATFLAREAGTYHTRLTIRARRNFGGRDIWSYDCATMDIDVRPRTWTVWAEFGGYVSKPAVSSSSQVSSFKGHVGGNVLLTRVLGLRFDEGVYTYHLQSDTAAGVPSGSVFLDGSVVSASATFDGPGNLLLRPHLGGYFSLVRNKRVGPNAGIDLLAEFSGRWMFALSFEGRWLRRLDSPMVSYFDASGVFGVAYAL